MQQLSGLDHLFLKGEDTRQHMHIAALGIYDPSSAEGGEVRFKTMLEFFANRAKEVAFFRRRLVRVPLDFDRPYWIEDADIDTEYHVRHIALPAPGDWRQLMIQVARIHSRALDLSRPPWEVYIIGGLDAVENVKKGSFALYLKMHHAAVDGQAASQLIQVLHSLSPEYDKHPKVNVVVKDREPGNLELALRTCVHRGKQVVDATKLAVELNKTSIDLSAKYGPDLVKRLRTNLASKFIANRSFPSRKSLESREPVAKTRFDAAISPHRVVDAVSLPLQECKVIRECIPGATVNDIFLAVSSGTLRKYLQFHNELPATSINSMMPMAATGKKKNAESANNVSSTIVSLHSDIEDPIERLYAIKKSTNKSKQFQDDIGRDLLPRLMDVIPAALAPKLLEFSVQDQASLTVSNVRGPDRPLYLAGAKCQMIVPVSFPYDKMGLNITGFSYLGTLWICITACRDLLPDPGFFSQCMRESFQELLQASLARVEKKAATPRKRGAVKKSPARKTPAKRNEKSGAAS